MRKFKSRKGATLVELVITIAILAITAGMGVGIFASAMNNYSQASVIAKEQERATEIEDFITTSARVCQYLYFVDQSAVPVVDPSTAQILNPSDIDALVLGMTNKQEVDYMTIDAGSKVAKYKNVMIDYNGNKNESLDLSVNGVDNIVFDIFKQKVLRDPDEDINSGQFFYYLQYQINMERGYSVSGCVLLNNISNQTTNRNSEFIEKGNVGTFVVGSNDYDKTGIVFKLNTSK